MNINAIANDINSTSDHNKQPKVGKLISMKNIFAKVDNCVAQK